VIEATACTANTTRNKIPYSLNTKRKGNKQTTTVRPNEVAVENLSIFATAFLLCLRDSLTALRSSAAVEVNLQASNIAKYAATQRQKSIDFKE
jgi:hypothetical protein